MGKPKKASEFEACASILTSTLNVEATQTAQEEALDLSAGYEIKPGKYAKSIIETLKTYEANMDDCVRNSSMVIEAVSRSLARNQKHEMLFDASGHVAALDWASSELKEAASAIKDYVEEVKFAFRKAK
jgi:hypothetical protein